MAHNLGLRTIAEGVETAAVLEQLQAYGCDEVQGYYLAKPMPADAFMVYLQHHLRQGDHTTPGTDCISIGMDR